ncbi:MAG: VIT1/CCC1 transporter family protein [Minisyncoccia bacterium]
MKKRGLYRGIQCVSIGGMQRHMRVKKIETRLQDAPKRSGMSAYLKEIIYGGVDGSITTFAVVAGFSGAAFSNETTSQLSFFVVLLFGVANLLADGVSMGLGNFLAVRSEQSQYKGIRKKEEYASLHDGEREAVETKSILVQKGFSHDDAHTLTSIFRKNEQYWVDFLMDNELKISDPMSENPILTGLATFAAFVTFGLIPLVPFVIFGSFDPQTVFEFSAIGAGTALILLGVLKWKIVGTKLIKSVGEIVTVGGAAASIAFFVGTLFTF